MHFVHYNIFPLPNPRAKCEKADTSQYFLPSTLLVSSMMCCTRLYLTILLQLVLEFIFSFVYCPPCTSAISEMVSHALNYIQFSSVELGAIISQKKIYISHEVGNEPILYHTNLFDTILHATFIFLFITTKVTNCV
jgi:hypothetical protein